MGKSKNEFFNDIEDAIKDQASFMEKEKYVEDGLSSKKTGPIEKIWEAVQWLWKYVQDDTIPWTNKVAPLGALVYLVMPIDLIPDAIPVAGLLDDAGVIGFAIKSIWDQLNIYSGGEIEKLELPSFTDVKDWFTSMHAEILLRPVSYAEAIQYFMHHKKDDAAIAKAAMLRETLPNGHINFTQVFLDRNNNLVCGNDAVPLGRRIETTGLDAELLNVFKDKDLVMVN